jgi:hypothetical protein
MAQVQAPTSPALLPNSPATDVLGNPTAAGMVAGQPAPAEQSVQTTAPGAAALATVPGQDTENLPLPPSGGASIFQTLSARNSPHLQRMVQSTKGALNADPTAAAKPGGWAKALVGGAIDALGDAAAASAPAPHGGGALTGVMRTLQARGQRIAGQQEAMSREKTQELLRAETMQRIAANTRNTYRQDQETRTATYTDNAKYMDTFRKRYQTQEDRDNVTNDEVNEMLKKNPDFWKTHTGRATGEEPVMEGGKQKVVNGEPVFSPLFSISKGNAQDPERTHPISEAESKYIEDNAGDEVPANTPMTQHVYDNVMVRADAAHDAKRKIEKANDEEMSEEQARQLRTVLQDPQIQHYVSMDPALGALGGLNKAAQNTQAHIDFIDQKIAAVQKAAPGQDNPVLQQLQQERQRQVEGGQKIQKAMSGFNDAAHKDYETRLDEQRKETETERHNRADEAVKQAELNAAGGGGKNVPLTPEIKQQIDSLPAPQKAILNQYDSNTQSSLMAIAFGNGEQELEKNFPSRLTKGAPGLNTQQALGVIHQLNPNWSEQSYGIKQGMYKSATTGKLSQQSDSLNNFIGHAAEAQTVTNKLFNAADPRIFKGTVNALSKLGYGTDAVSLQEAISVVNGEFDNMVKAGYAPTQDEVAAQSSLINANSTVGQINAALKVMANMATTRASTMNQHYKTATGNNFPNLINEDNQDNARALGIPVEKFYTGGRIGGSGNAPQMQNTQTGAPGAAAPKAPGNTGGAWGTQFGAVPRTPQGQ